MSLAGGNLTFDGFQGLTQGVDSGRSPALLDNDQLAWAVNATSRNNFISCRPGWKKIELEFKKADPDTGILSDDATVQSNFEDKIFQGAHSYLNERQDSFIVASIGGRIFRINLESLNVQDLSESSSIFQASTCLQAWMVQAEKFLVIQNDQDIPIIFDGAEIRYSNIKGGEIPGGSVMEYNRGRIWLVTAENSGNFIGGDLAYSVTGDVKDVLGFTENTFLNGGGFFSTASSDGRINAMRSIAQQDTTTGQGALQVFTEQAIYSVNAPFDRDSWAATRNPIQTISNLQGGAVGQRNTVNINGDIWYRSPQGVRSFMVARRNHGQWVNTPQSEEMARAFDYDSPSLLKYGSGVVFDNRLLMTTQPETNYVSGTDHGITHKALGVLDFSNVSRMLNNTTPVWDGIWTGLKILQILTVDTKNGQRCFVFALSSSNKVELWEITKRDRFDQAVDGTDKRISWSFESPEFPFQDGGWERKRLRYSDIWYDRVAGQVDFTARFRDDEYPLWKDWHSWQTQATYKDCDIPRCGEPEQMREQYRPRVRLPSPDSSCDSIVDKPHNEGYRFAVRVEVTGYARVKKLRLVSDRLPEENEGECPSASETTSEVKGCPIDDYSYTIGP